jgi:hypothetical protein
MPPERLASYHKLMGEAQFAAAQTDARLLAQKDHQSRTRREVKDYPARG